LFEYAGQREILNDDMRRNCETNKVARQTPFQRAVRLKCIGGCE